MVTDSVLISMSPYSCRKLLEGSLLCDIRRQRPNVSGPFRVYVYCTKTGDRAQRVWVNATSGLYVGNERVIGEYVCNDVAEFSISASGRLLSDRPLTFSQLVTESGFTAESQIVEYIRQGKANKGRVWYVSDFTLYDKPLLLKDFDKLSVQTPVRHSSQALTHAPMSFAYVELRSQPNIDVTNFQRIRGLQPNQLVDLISCSNIEELRRVCSHTEQQCAQCRRCKLEWLCAPASASKGEDHKCHTVTK